MHLATRQLSRAKEAVERLQAARKVGFLSFLSAPATSQYLEDQYRKAVDKAAEGLLAAEAFALLNMSMAQARFDKATVELRIARTKEAPAP